MTPHPHPRRVPMRRSAALLAAMLVILGAPLAAQALGDDITVEVAQPWWPTDEPGSRSTTSTSDLDAVIVAVIDAVIDAVVSADPLTDRPEALRDAVPDDEVPDDEVPHDEVPVTVSEPVVDPVIVLLADTYSWAETGDRVAVLQETLGVVADGVYGHATQRAHRNALEFVGLPTDTVPAPVLPPGPSPAEWEALRWCESNGNYAITNPSGKYRGAYQFDRPTWNSVADRYAPHLVGVDPAAASPADQDFMALALYSERGARPWPHCGRHLS